MFVKAISKNFILYLTLTLITVFAAPASLFAAPATSPSKSTTAPATKTPGALDPSQIVSFDSAHRPNLITEASVLSLLALLPFIVMILTPFLKISVVLSLLRTALGVQQAPPNQVVNGVAFMLSLYIMYPTALQMYDKANKVTTQLNAPDSLVSKESAGYIIAIANEVKEPMRDFLKKNTSVQHQKVFYRMVYKVLPEVHRDELKPEDFVVLVPSFITTQLKSAFEIGVLIYVPFFVIDLVTSNILLAMGMMMLSPVTISMPLKLFLLVMLDGWTLLIEGLVTTFLR